ncbi:MAG: GrpB family protein [Bdellovibrionales bacterium]|nr:GrpB family protein [Bdellovibrionales bacterium]
MLGLYRDELKLVDYDESWPEQFEAEAIRLQPIEQLLSQKWQHIGSTAVPGLMAKPIIDMMIRVPKPQIQAVADQLVEAGYQEGGFLYSERSFLMFKAPEPITHTLHLLDPDSDEYQDKLAFRDFLRSNEKARSDYQQLKLKVSRRLRNDRKKYGQLKSFFILNQLKKLRSQP